ncbi:glycerol-3-phosphate ABC transporter permease [Paenibacillus glucanolyticus]|uniref:Glycerol-3-phosphate ABC transporter permease n=1 Tax=Paenibacillus glucanolyticus TaxID=59843 RepID=A0A163L8M2_9BACL|nr:MULTISPECIES: carbohydrate ABC transporter permease [Paenibacillus]AWP28590.1 glycerol-3-phosphate ABC transporter permease [Paenibacillus sp. Cedars]KZS47900.1 glycerol-3-phosphate ABC transporter permease [Paenibacillus glucanolyticus]MDH6671671.1 sn-glycerol 3-phosphate transport system permease protein [Paenibacillus sp. LBL]
MNMRLMPKSFVYIALLLGSLAVAFPLLYTLSTSLMSEAESAVYPPPLLPGAINLSNFAKVIDTIPVLTFIGNSLIVSIAIMLGQIVTASLAAYAFAFLRFPGKTLLFSLFLATMMIPWEVIMIPNYLTVKSLNWLDTYQGLIVPFLATAFGTFLLRQTFLQLPKELFEAARVDGCGHVRIFLKMVLPLSIPGIATLGVYSFLNNWNMYLWPLLTTNRVEMRTVQIGIGMLQFEEMNSWNLILSGVLLLLLPSLLLLALGLKPLVRGITAGALKG